MIAQPVEISKENPPEIARQSWITINEASRRSGLKMRALQVRCFEFKSRGLAKLESPPGGGKARWLIREDADPALAHIKFPEQMPPDIEGISDDRIAEWGKRIEIYFAWLEAQRAAVRADGHAGQGSAKFIAEQAAKGEPISLPTLYDWHKRYRARGKEGLLDERWRQRTCRPGLCNLMLKEVSRLYLTKQKLSVRLCYEAARQTATEKGWTIHSPKQVRAHIDRIPLAVKVLKRRGEKAYTDEIEPYLIRDYSTLASNEHWNSDHHIFDVQVRVSHCVNPETGEVTYKHARPWLTSWQDCASRKIVGWVVRFESPDTDAILLSFRRAVAEHGVPEHAYTDNGKDYDSFALHGRTKKQRRTRVLEDGRIDGVFAVLGVKGHNVQSYHGQSKIIERFHGTVCERFSKLFASYTGRNAQEKPEGLEERLAAGKAPTMEEFLARFGEFIADYNSRPHSGDSMQGKTPDRVWQERLVTKRTLPLEQLDFLMWKQSQPVCVTRNGVRWNSLSYGQFDIELARRIGQKVTLRVDPADVSRVAVYDLAGKFIAAAQCNHRIPANSPPEVLKEALARKKKFRKTQREYAEGRLRMHEDLPDTMFRVAEERRQREATVPIAGDATVTPVRTPFQGDLKLIQRAFEAIKPLETTSRHTVDDMLRYYENRKEEPEVPQTPFCYESPYRQRAIVPSLEKLTGQQSREGAA